MRGGRCGGRVGQPPAIPAVPAVTAAPGPWQDFFGEAARDPTVARLVGGIDVALGLLCNLLFLLAVVCNDSGLGGRARGRGEGAG